MTSTIRRPSPQPALSLGADPGDQAADGGYAAERYGLTEVMAPSLHAPQSRGGEARTSGRRSYRRSPSWTTSSISCPREVGETPQGRSRQEGLPKRLRPCLDAKGYFTRESGRLDETGIFTSWAERRCSSGAARTSIHPRWRRPRQHPDVRCRPWSVGPILHGEVGRAYIIRSRGRTRERRVSRRFSRIIWRISRPGGISSATSSPTSAAGGKLDLYQERGISKEVTIM